MILAENPYARWLNQYARWLDRGAVFLVDRNNLSAIQDLFIFAVALYTVDEATMMSPIAIETTICSVPYFPYFSKHSWRVD